MTGRREKKPLRPLGDYEIGYGRPPVTGRFKPGNIANPNGRRKPKKTVAQTIDETMSTRVKSEQTGKSMTIQEIIIQNLARAAARSDIKAIQTLFNIKDRYRDSAETTLHPADLEPEDRKIIEEHLARLQANARASDAPETGDATTNDKGADHDDDSKPKDGEGDQS